MAGLKMLYELRDRIRAYWYILQDSRTPLIAKGLLLSSVIYILFPFDILPDVIPFSGYLDDLIMSPVLFYIAGQFIPSEVWEEDKRKAEKKS